MSPGFGLEYRCNIRGNDSALCFNQGTCISSLEDGDTCTNCESGFGSDNLAFHLKDCTLPYLFIPIWFGISLAVSLLGISLVLRKARAKSFNSKLRNVSVMWCVCCVTELGVITGMFIQNGLFEISIVMAAINFTLQTRFAVDLIFLVIFATIPQNIEQSEKLKTTKKTFHGAQIAASTTFITISIAMLVFCRDANPRQFNAVNLIQMVFFIVIFVSFGGVAVLKTARLIKLLASIENEDNSEVIHTQTGKLKGVKDGVLNYCIASVTALVIIIICFLVLGSFPFQYVFAPLFWSFPYTFTNMCTLLNSSPASSSRSKDRSPSFTIFSSRFAGNVVRKLRVMWHGPGRLQHLEHKIQNLIVNESSVNPDFVGGVNDSNEHDDSKLII